MGEVQGKVVVKVSLTRDPDSSKGRIPDSESQRVDKASKVIHNKTSISRDNRDHQCLTARLVGKSILEYVISQP